VSLRSVSICIIDEQGKVCHEAKTAAQPAAIADCLKGFSAEVKAVALEAGTLTQYLTYGLQAAGFEVVCMEARQVKNTLAAMRNKTDRNDARGIAQILRTGWYSRVHVKSMLSHRLRALLASRKAILKRCVDLENELRGLLRVFGICLPARVAHGGFDQKVRQSFADDEMLACALNPLLDARTMLYKTYLKLDNAVKTLVKADPVCKLLMSVPGVGPVTALSFKAGVDDPNRFKSSRTVGAHFGLTPRRFQSGENDNPGAHLTSRRCRSTVGALRGGALAAHAQRAVVFAESLGHPPGQDSRPPSCRDCGRPQARDHPAPHVARRHGLSLEC
jgi:transposase